VPLRTPPTQSLPTRCLQLHPALSLHPLVDAIPIQRTISRAIGCPFPCRLLPVQRSARARHSVFHFSPTSPGMSSGPAKLHSLISHFPCCRPFPSAFALV